jgi:hypothetical protein
MGCRTPISFMAASLEESAHPVDHDGPGQLLTTGLAGAEGVAVVVSAKGAAPSRRRDRV